MKKKIDKKRGEKDFVYLLPSKIESEVGNSVLTTQFAESFLEEELSRVFSRRRVESSWVVSRFFFYRRRTTLNEKKKSQLIKNT